ncbi:MAG: hydrogenase iron-sulfur subunit [Gammaproteobacteria bacterium]
MRRVARLALEKIESAYDAVFTPAWNPLYQLGALGWFFYWIVAASGIYLYIFFDSGVTDAYVSVERITNVQWYAGGVMRSFHRYASDALVIVVMIHLVREYILDRLRGARWFAWVTGVAALWMIFAAGISGYWIVWDLLAQYIAIAFTEWLDALPIFGESIARNFLHSASLSGRFFTLMVFIHIFVPLVLLLVMWLHIHRHVGAKVNPPRGLAIGTSAAMLALAFVWPAHSQGPADLDTVPAVLGLDWFYLAALPLSEHVSGLGLWAGFGIATLVLVLMPWLPPARSSQVAVVNLANCNGCGRCHEDCPFGAVTMEPRSDAAPYPLEAVVNADQCVSCGICTGACPTSTPFRRRSEPVAGIEQPGLTTQNLRERCISAVEQLSGPERVLVVGCSHGAQLQGLTTGSVGVVELPCVGMLPPAFIDFLITRDHVDGIMLTGCREGDCHFRHGIRWTRQRIERQRDPYLRERVPRERLASCFPGVDRPGSLADAIVQFREQLTAVKVRRKAQDTQAASSYIPQAEGVTDNV